MWKSIDLAKEIYKIIQESKDFSKDFGLKDQIQRSSVAFMPMNNKVLSEKQIVNL